jgi:hypothetical protein
VSITWCKVGSLGWVLGILVRGGEVTNSVEDRGQRERGCGGASPLVRGAAQFANRWNPYSY